MVQWSLDFKYPSKSSTTAIFYSSGQQKTACIMSFTAHFAQPAAKKGQHAGRNLPDTRLSLHIFTAHQTSPSGTQQQYFLYCCFAFWDSFQNCFKINKYLMIYNASFFTFSLIIGHKTLATKDLSTFMKITLLV